MHMRLLTISVALCVAMVVAVTTAMAIYTKHQWDVRRDDQLAACDRGNQIRVTINEIILVSAQNVAPVAIIDCKKVIR